jgi:peptide-methionine (S)-S-oxide reductase
MNYTKSMRVLFVFLVFCISPSLFAMTDQAIFAGGCFWCVEHDFDEVKGVDKTLSGYDGGNRPNPNYQLVSSGTTNYKEVVKVSYDPFDVSYRKLVEYFFRHIDLLDGDGQFCDRGKQYSTAIYYLNDKQKQIALDVKKKLSAKFDKPIKTQILPATNFTKAEDYHQNYHTKNPIRYNYYRYRCGRDKRIHEVWHGKS